MIKKFIDRLLGKSARAGARGKTADAAADDGPSVAVADAPQPAVPVGVRVEVPQAEHRIDATLLDANAVRVVKTLQDAGHAAYIVGGAVRDLLVGLRPKDWDVATDATPEQVKALFRRAFIIGRRFRLVHVVFGRGREHETIEVSTFRAYLDTAGAEQVVGNEKTGRAALADKTHVVDASGRVLRDNVWGPQIEDAARRDFTINAMYYDPLTHTVVDYHGGIADAKARVLRMIGDPVTRYREDPVRIVRVVRFAAKLGFEIEPASREPIRAMAALLANVPPSRLFDEMVKLLQTGHALASIDELRKQGLDRGIFPVLDAALAPAGPETARTSLVRLALKDTDRRVAEGRAVAPSFMLACLLWHDVQRRWTTLRQSGESPFPALQQAVDAAFEARIGDISGRGKLAADMREIWLMQPRFERRTVSGATSLINQVRFRAGYDFLRLRADVGEVPVELADWWEDFHLGSEDEREALLNDLRKAAPGRGGTKRAAGPPAPEATAGRDGVMAAPGDSVAVSSGESAVEHAGATDDGDNVEAGADAPGSATPRRKRRRRRRPTAAEASGASPGDAADAPAAPGDAPVR